MNRLTTSVFWIQWCSNIENRYGHYSNTWSECKKRMTCVHIKAVTTDSKYQYVTTVFPIDSHLALGVTRVDLFAFLMSNKIMHSSVSQQSLAFSHQGSRKARCVLCETPTSIHDCKLAPRGSLMDGTYEWVELGPIFMNGTLHRYSIRKHYWKTEWLLGIGESAANLTQGENHGQ